MKFSPAAHYSLLFLALFLFITSPSTSHAAWTKDCNDAKAYIDNFKLFTQNNRTDLRNLLYFSRKDIAKDRVKQEAAVSTQEYNEKKIAGKMFAPEGVAAVMKYGQLTSSQVDDGRRLIKSAGEEFNHDINEALNKYWATMNPVRKTYYKALDTAMNTYETGAVGAYDQAIKDHNTRLTWINTSCNGTPPKTLLQYTKDQAAVTKQVLNRKLSDAKKARTTAETRALNVMIKARDAAIEKLNGVKKIATQRYFNDVQSSYFDLYTKTSHDGVIDESNNKEIDKKTVNGFVTAAEEFANSLKSAMDAYSAPTTVSQLANADIELGTKAVNAMAAYGESLRTVSKPEIKEGLKQLSERYKGPTEFVANYMDALGHPASITFDIANEEALDKLADATKRVGPGIYGGLAQKIAELTPQERLKAYAEIGAALVTANTAVPEEPEVDIEDIKLEPANGSDSNKPNTGSDTDDWVGSSVGGDTESWTCFDGDVPVVMFDGTEKPIKEIKLGDEVMSYDKYANQIPHKVTHVFVHQVNHALIVNSVIVTPEHRFLRPDGTFAHIGTLKIGDLIVDSEGRNTPITKISTTDAPRTVYNLEVDVNHTYIAGGYRVHNRK